MSDFCLHDDLESGSQLEALLPFMGLLEITGDILGCFISQASSRQSSGKLLNILQCTGQSPPLQRSIPSERLVVPSDKAWPSGKRAFIVSLRQPQPPPQLALWILKGVTGFCQLQVMSAFGLGSE